MCIRICCNFWKKMVFFRHPKIRFLLVHGQVNWNQLLVRSNKCTTWTTRIIDFATPVCKTQLYG